ncbi:MAG: hypothetical protein U0P81_10720 [Holophagaceae bacterium]
MNPLALRLAAELGGSLLSGPGPSLDLLAIERVKAHGLPQVLVASAHAPDLLEPLAAIASAQEAGLDLNLVAVLVLPGTVPEAAFRHHRRRLGALSCALDAGLAWLGGRPMLAKRLPGRIRAARPVALPKAPLAPLEKAELKAFLPDWDKARRQAVFRQPPWAAVADGLETLLWPGVEPPEGAELLVAPLVLPTATPLAEALRISLRAALGQAVPCLPLPGDPTLLHALRGLGPEVAAFRGPEAAWRQAFERIAALPAPPHFCARC